MKNNKRKIWFVRHAESVTNADRTIKSDNFASASLGITKKGVKQSEYLAENFNEKPDLIVTSPFLRAKETAAPLIKKYKNARLEEWNVQEFTYLSINNCKNTDYSTRQPIVERYWKRCDPLYRDGEGAETFVEFMKRVENTIDKAKISKGEKIIIFSHEFFILAIKYLLDKNPKKITAGQMGNFREYYFLNRIPNMGIIEISNKLLLNL